MVIYFKLNSHGQALSLVRARQTNYQTLDTSNKAKCPFISLLITVEKPQAYTMRKNTQEEFM